MRHLTVSDFGQFLGVTGNRLTVTSKDGGLFETPLSRLRSIRIAKPGISISSNLILACAARGIRLYFTDWKNEAVAAVGGQNQHAVVEVRRAQFRCADSLSGREIACQFLISKIRNQRAVLLYFGKYFTKAKHDKVDVIKKATSQLDSLCLNLKNGEILHRPDWREKLMGYEGICAHLYWATLVEVGLLPSTFVRREGRGSVEPTNAALNYAYTILSSYCWSALDNAGFELYAGFLHTSRPGKPALVLDFLEEYRAWVVDRNIIKLRGKIEGAESLTKEVKKAIVDAIDETMATPILRNGKKLKLENLMQRQVYKLAGAVVDSKKYKGIRFKW